MFFHAYICWPKQSSKIINIIMMLIGLAKISYCKIATGRVDATFSKFSSPMLNDDAFQLCLCSNLAEIENRCYAI
jgi:hypothetical protein